MTPVVSYVYGLGGRDIFVSQIEQVFETDLPQIARAGKVEQVRNFIGLRE
jgi:pyruvate/2-oxoacid:ferredoxin oxidoreductase alpha subunit